MKCFSMLEADLTLNSLLFAPFPILSVQLCVLDRCERDAGAELRDVDS